jgi:outer membrane protein assembly factor BamB
MSRSNKGPGIRAPLIIVTLALVLRFVPGWIAPITLVHFISLGLTPLLGILALSVWWMLSRRVPLRERFAGLGLGIGIFVVGAFVAHPTMRQVLVTHGVPTAMIFVVGALVLTRTVPWRRRRWIVLLGLAIAFLPWAALRQDGQVGDLAPELSLRFSPTAEERFLARHSGTRDAPSAGTLSLRDAWSDWPGFRGPARDARIFDLSFETDWEENPPREIWRRAVGPGWSSFAVAGDLVFTQEQRGVREVVVCYSLSDGREIWAQGTEDRFDEPAAGPGPRATPTFDRGRIYAVGANGTVQCLDAADGERLWQRNLQQDVEAPLPTWGFSSSPLVVGRTVVVFAGGADGRAAVGYERETGEMLWSAGQGALSYSSGHLARIGDVDQVLISSDIGVEALDPQDGRLIWEHRWPTTQMPRIVQPVVLDDDSVIVATGYGYGSRRLSLERQSAGDWIVRELWTSRFLKPYFNDLVCHEGSCYGFDNKIFTGIDAGDGRRHWKGGRYGHGQVVLFPEMDLLLVLTEQGQVVLLEATPEAHREVGRFQALAGKTWNHPVVTQGKLLLRNGEEAACFELPGARGFKQPPTEPGMQVSNRP